MKPTVLITPDNCLSNHEKVAAEFNIDKNRMTPDQINAKSKSARKYWWKCSESHEWEASVAIRIDHNNKCPYCAGRLATPENNLLTLHPEIAILFNEIKNGKPANDVTPTYGGKMYWLCTKGHEFFKSPKETVRTKGLCRECNSLAYKFPELREQYHPDSTISFESLSYGSNKKVQWKCNQGHEYVQTVNKKTERGYGCPYCSGRYATPENNLLDAYPEIAKQFDSVKSETTPDQVTPSSNLVMWWKCSEGHSYDTTPNKKTREDLPYGCPYCSGYRIDETNSFGHLFPELAKEFLSEVNRVTPYEVPCGRTHTIYAWKCEEVGHIFQASVAARTKKGTGCPYCYGRYATSQNNLAVIKPEDAKHFHPTKNGNLTAYDFTPFSSQDVQWLCENGHEWTTTPNAKKGCPQCSMSATSKVEQFLKESLTISGIMDFIEPETVKLQIKWRKNSTMTVDILAHNGDKKFAIEYDGYYFHSGIHSGDREDDYLKDTQKTQALLDAGYHVVRIREINFNGTLDLIEIEDTRLLQLHHKYSNRLPTDSFNGVIQSISEWMTEL